MLFRSKVNYAVQGDVRLIRVPNTGTARDTILLPGLRGSGASALLDGDVAYISAGGDASFASFPYTLIATGGITKVDLRGKRVGVLISGGNIDIAQFAKYLA